MGTYNAIKSYTGSLRPNFFSACDYKGYAAALETGDFTAYFASTTAGRARQIATSCHMMVATSPHHVTGAHHVTGCPPT
jgi:hypothetical protein